MSSLPKVTALAALGASLALALPTGSPAAAAQAASAPWYKDVVQVMDGSAGLDTGDGRPARDGRGYKEALKGHAAPVFHDLTGDGLPDLVVGDFSGRFRLYANKGTRAAPAFNGYDWVQADGGDAILGNFCCTATGVRFADIDGDGIADLTAGSYLPGHIYWFPGQAGGFGARQTLTLGSGLSILPRQQGGPNDNFAAKPAWMDWDDDGKLDLLIGDQLGDLLILRNVGRARFPGSTPLAHQPVYGGAPEGNVFNSVKGGGGKFADEEYLSPTVADWNGDGLNDLIVATQSGAVYLLANTGSKEEPAFGAPSELLPAVPGGEYVPAQLVRPGEVAKANRGSRASVDVADWNGDGKLDLILGDWSRSFRARSNLSAAEEQGLNQALMKLVALDKKAALQEEPPLRESLQKEQPLRERKRFPVFFENEALAAELATIEAELTPFLEPVAKEASTRLSDYERNHGYVRVYLRR